MTDRNELVTRAKAMISAHSEFVIKIGGKVISSGMMPELVARIEQDAATIARLTGERERLALAICGGEDVPGYANAQPVEALEKVARDNAAAAMWQIDRTLKTEATAARLRAELDEARGALLPVLAIAERNERGVETDRARAILAKIDSEDRKEGA